jgi:hypothetical protein
MHRLVTAPLLLLVATGCASSVPGPAPVYQTTTAPLFQPVAAAPTVQPTPMMPGLPASAAPAILPGPITTVPAVQPAVVIAESRTFLPGTNYEATWDAVVDVVDDYFDIEQEEPVRLLGNTLTEGRILTRPEIGATIFEPWRRTSVGLYQRVESTLQSIRRYAEIRVMPGEGGFWVEVAVFKELEDVIQPERATAGAATFRNDSSLVRVETPVGQQEVHQGWIQLGRDPVLEQEMLAVLQSRYGSTPLRVFTPGL